MIDPTTHSRSRHRYLLVAAALLLALAAAAWYASPDGRLHVYFLDTPGDAFLIQTPRGGFVLVDGGEDPALLALHLGRRLPFWQRHLEAVVLTRSDAARLPGQVAALARYRAAVALAPPDAGGARSEQKSANRSSGLQSSTEELQATWQRLLEEQATPLHTARPGARLNLDGLTLTVLAVETQAAGLVLRLDYGRTSVVLNGAGDITTDAALLADAQPITALAYPWQRELDTPLLAAWQPRVIIFTSAGEASEPALLTMAEREIHGAAVYHERVNGTVELISDGRRVWVLTEK